MRVSPTPCRGSRTRGFSTTGGKERFRGSGSFFGAEGADDAAILTLELEGGTVADGAFATIDPSWSRGAGYPLGADVALRISGTTGVLDVDPFARPLRIFDHETRAPSWSYTGEDMNELMLADFLRGVTEDDPTCASGSTA